jgi:hypothetical protein
MDAIPAVEAMLTDIVPEAARAGHLRVALWREFCTHYRTQVAHDRVRGPGEWRTAVARLGRISLVVGATLKS